jgi:hypothetical protein
MAYGVMVQPDPNRKMGKWFLHTCLCDEHTFQYNPDQTTWLSFATVEEAQSWLTAWYRQRKQSHKWMPEKDRFTITEIPSNPIVNTITKDITERTNDEETFIRYIV